MKEFIFAHIEKILALAGSISGFFIGKYSERQKLKNSSDVKTFDALTQKMPEFSRIKLFFNEMDLKNSFKTDVLGVAHDVLRDFCQDRTKNFHNKNVNSKMIDAWNAIRELSEEVGSRTSPDPNGWQTISREKYGHGVDDFESGEILNDMANAFFYKYEEFLAEAKKELLI
ncbi:MAG: hypothetical protein KDD61_00610 [Bdellovibrionales bacterium]|nr:hypothetical protein [Bdellovibrionales bacterium]